MFYVNKWHVFGVSALLQCAAGASYCFAIYAGVLKEALGLTQAQARLCRLSSYVRFVCLYCVNRLKQGCAAVWLGMDYMMVVVAL